MSKQKNTFQIELENGQKFDTSIDKRGDLWVFLPNNEQVKVVLKASKHCVDNTGKGNFITLEKYIELREEKNNPTKNKNTDEKKSSEPVSKPKEASSLDPNYNSALLEAINDNDIEKVLDAIDKGADVNTFYKKESIINNCKFTELEISALGLATIKGYKRIAKILVARHASFDSLQWKHPLNLKYDILSLYERYATKETSEVANVSEITSLSEPLIKTV